MTVKRLICTSIFVAVLSVVVSSGVAEARYGCRGRSYGWNSGWRHNNVYYSNNTVPATTYATNDNMNSMPATAPTADGQPMPQDANYSASKPVIVEQPAHRRRAPAPIYNNQVPATPNFPANNPSPDVDNSAKNLTTSGIPGTQPAKAPEPPAAAAPKQQ